MGAGRHLVIRVSPVTDCWTEVSSVVYSVSFFSDCRLSVFWEKDPGFWVASITASFLFLRLILGHRIGSGACRRLRLTALSHSWTSLGLTILPDVGQLDNGLAMLRRFSVKFPSKMERER